MLLIKSTPRLLGRLLCLYSMAAALPVYANTRLEELNLEDLMNISITGASKYEQKQQQVAAAISVLTRNDFRTYGWRTLNEALASLPGVHATHDNQYNYLGMRGFGLPGDSNTRVLITINGNRINDATYDAGPTGRDFPLDIDLIERIEFIPGPGGAVYGQNAMLGVVNVITRKGEDVKGAELSASYQTAEVMPQGRFTLGKKFVNGLDALVSISGMQSRGTNHFFDFGDAGVAGVARHMDGQNIKQLFARAAYGPLSFDFIYGDRRKDDSTGAFRSTPLVDGAFTRDRYLNTQVQYNDSFANGTLNVLGRLFLGHYRFNNVLFFDGQPTESTGPSNWHGAEMRLLSTALTNHALMLGVEYQNNTDIRQTFLNPADALANVAVNTSVLRIGVYAQDEWRISDTLSATVGLRYDYNQWIGSRLSPRGALIWQAMPQTTFKALYGRAHRSPNSFERDFSDDLTQVANPGLRSESIDTIELVADYRPLANMNLRATAYAWDMYNPIALGINGDTGLPQFQQTTGKIKARGVELSSDTTWSWGARLRANFGVQNARQQGSHLSNSPTYLGKLNLSVPVPLMTGLRAGYELQYFGKRKTLDGSDTNSYLLSNLSLITDVRWVKGLEASLSVYNLFNKHYEHPAADTNWQNSFAQPGRTIRLKIDYRF